MTFSDALVFNPAYFEQDERLLPGQCLYVPARNVVDWSAPFVSERKRKAVETVNPRAWKLAETIRIVDRYMDQKFGKL